MIIKSVSTAPPLLKLLCFVGKDREGSEKEKKGTFVLGSHSLKAQALPQGQIGFINVGGRMLLSGCQEGKEGPFNQSNVICGGGRGRASFPFSSSSLTPSGVCRASLLEAALLLGFLAG